MSDWYESMSRTPIRDGQLKEPFIRRSRRPFVILPSHLKILYIQHRYSGPQTRHSSESWNPEVLFTLIAERYERRSLGITSNLVFSQWDKVFANPMATAAAIDRLVHHSIILEFDVPSYRTGAAQQRLQQEDNRQE